MHEITFKPGEGCGSYRVLSLIGIGGVAEVYKAVHQTSNTIVALKALRRFFVDNMYLREHMLAEARLLTALHQSMTWVIFFTYVFLVSGFWARILALVGA